MPRWSKIDPWLLGLLALAAVLLFADLSDQILWNDEAGTALFARNVLTFGYPTAFDGTNWIDRIIIEQTIGRVGNYLDVFHSWGMYYVLAPFFFLFGESTFIARFPFGCFGLASVYLTYRVAFAYFGGQARQPGWRRPADDGAVLAEASAVAGANEFVVLRIPVDGTREMGTGACEHHGVAVLLHADVDDFVFNVTIPSVFHGNAHTDGAELWSVDAYPAQEGFFGILFSTPRGGDEETCNGGDCNGP